MVVEEEEITRKWRKRKRWSMSTCLEWEEEKERGREIDRKAMFTSTGASSSEMGMGSENSML